MCPPPPTLPLPHDVVPPNGNGTSSAVVVRPTGKTWSTRFAAAVRWLHIYVSLLGFTALVFFAVTGITLNHPTWFGVDAQRITNAEGTLPHDWLHLPDMSGKPPAEAESAEAVEIDYARQIDRLAVVEHLRATHGLRGAVSEFRVDEYECMVLFKGPGYAADVIVDRATGKYSVTQTRMGAVAIINDLHKGRDSGWVWSLVIDVSALLTVFVSVTGVVLIFYLRRKRLSGIITAVVGTILFAAIYWLWVP